MDKKFKDLVKTIKKDYGDHGALKEAMANAVINEAKSVDPQISVVQEDTEDGGIKIKWLKEPKPGERVTLDFIRDVYKGNMAVVKEAIEKKRLPATMENDVVYVLKSDLFRVFPAMQSIETRRYEFLGQGAFFRTLGKFKMKNNMLRALAEEDINGLT